MKAKLLVSTAFLAASVSLSAQKNATITVHADQGKEIIPKEIYGQFAEHLGSCIYDPGAAKRCPSPRRGAGREHHSLYQPGYRRSYGAGQRRPWIHWEGMRYALHGALTCWM